MTRCIGDWVGPRAGLDGSGKSRPHRDSIPGPQLRYAGPRSPSRSHEVHQAKPLCNAVTVASVATLPLCYRRVLWSSHVKQKLVNTSLCLAMCVRFVSYTNNTPTVVQGSKIQPRHYYRGSPQLPRTNFLKYYHLFANS